MVVGRRDAVVRWPEGGSDVGWREGQCNYGKQAFQSANNGRNKSGNNSDNYNGIFFQQDSRVVVVARRVFNVKPVKPPSKGSSQLPNHGSGGDRLILNPPWKSQAVSPAPLAEQRQPTNHQPGPVDGWREAHLI